MLTCLLNPSSNATTSFGSTIRTDSKYLEALIEKDVFWFPVPCCLRWSQVSPVKLLSETVIPSLANRPDALIIIFPSCIVVNTFILRLLCVRRKFGSVVLNLNVWRLVSLFFCLLSIGFKYFVNQNYMRWKLYQTTIGSVFADDFFLTQA